AGGLEDTTPVLGNQRIDEFAAIAFEKGEGSLLVRAHQPRISDNIGAEDRRKPPFYPLFGQSPAPREDKGGWQPPLGLARAARPRRSSVANSPLANRIDNARPTSDTRTGAPKTKR